MKVNYNTENPGRNWKVKNAKEVYSSLYLPHKVTHLTLEPDHMFLGISYFLVLGSLNQYYEKEIILHETSAPNYSAVSFGKVFQCWLFASLLYTVTITLLLAQIIFM